MGKPRDYEPDCKCQHCRLARMEESINELSRSISWLVEHYSKQA